MLSFFHAYGVPSCRFPDMRGNAPDRYVDPYPIVVEGSAVTCAM